MDFTTLTMVLLNWLGEAEPVPAKLGLARLILTALAHRR